MRGSGGFMNVAELVRSNDLCAHTIAAPNGGSAVRPDTTRPGGAGGRFETRWSRNARAHSTSGLENSLRVVHRTALGRELPLSAVDPKTPFLGRRTLV